MVVNKFWVIGGGGGFGVGGWESNVGRVGYRVLWVVPTFAPKGRVGQGGGGDVVMVEVMWWWW